MFTWKPELSVGQAAIDDDHKAFFSIANLLHDAAIQGDQRIVVESAINLLQEYIVGHFLREEMAMLSAKYPDTDAHIRSHAQFTRVVQQLVADYRSGIDGAAENLARQTGMWLREHIVSVDLKYKDWVKDSNVDSRPLGMLAGSPGDDVETDDLWGTTFDDHVDSA